MRLIGGPDEFQPHQRLSGLELSQRAAYRGTPRLIRSILAIQTDTIAALAGAAQGSASLWPSAMPAGQFATTVRNLADAFLGPWRLGNDVTRACCVTMRGKCLRVAPVPSRR